MEQYTSEDARREWRRILDKIQRGERVGITRYGELLAIVAPADETSGIHLDIPPRISAKLAEIAGVRSLDEWARNALIRAAEDAAPSLTRSAMWRGDVAGWCAAPDTEG